MQSRSRRQTEPSHVPRIRRNLRLNQNNVKHPPIFKPRMTLISRINFSPLTNHFSRPLHYSSPFDVRCSVFASQLSALCPSLFAPCRGYLILLSTSFSSFTTSAANLRIPSDVLSVAIALSFTRYLNFFSSSSSRSICADFAFSGLNFRSTNSVDSDNSFISSGLIVSRSQPASSMIWPVFRKLAPITSVGYPNFL